MINSAKFHLLGVCLGMSLLFKINFEVSTTFPPDTVQNINN